MTNHRRIVASPLVCSTYKSCTPEILKALLAAQGLDTEELDKTLKARAIEWREVAKKRFKTIRWAALVRDLVLAVCLLFLSPALGCNRWCPILELVI